jgi:hypothetical protein
MCIRAYNFKFQKYYIFLFSKFFDEIFLFYPYNYTFAPTNQFYFPILPFMVWDYNKFDL